MDELGEGAQGKVKIAERDCLATILTQYDNLNETNQNNIS